MSRVLSWCRSTKLSLRGETNRSESRSTKISGVRDLGSHIFLSSFEAGFGPNSSVGHGAIEFGNWFVCNKSFREIKYLTDGHRHEAPLLPPI